MNKLFINKKPIIAVVYLPPMPGYAKYPGMKASIDFVLEQVNILESENIDGVLLENENDHPYNVLATPEVIAAMTKITSKVTNKFKKIKTGVEFLINDPKASLAIAKIGDAHFIRTDYFVDKMSRPEYGGEMHIDPAGLIKYRQSIQANHIAIFSDIQVKYAIMLDPHKSLIDSAIEAQKNQSSGVVISGEKTGLAPTVKEIKKLKEAIGNFPIIIGSGLSKENCSELFRYADGAMVGSSLMENGIIIKSKVQELLGEKNSEFF